jgi:hypothetical protein
MSTNNDVHVGFCFAALSVRLAATDSTRYFVQAVAREHAAATVLHCTTAATHFA